MCIHRIKVQHVIHMARATGEVCCIMECNAQSLSLLCVSTLVMDMCIDGHVIILSRMVTTLLPRRQQRKVAVVAGVLLLLGEPRIRPPQVAGVSSRLRRELPGGDEGS